MKTQGIADSRQTVLRRRKHMAYNKEFTFEIIEKIAVLAEERSGWTKELNKVSFNGGEPKFDIRTWDPDHTKMGKGVTLSDEEMIILREAIADLSL